MALRPAELTHMPAVPECVCNLALWAHRDLQHQWTLEHWDECIRAWFDTLIAAQLRQGQGGKRWHQIQFGQFELDLHRPVKEQPEQNISIDQRRHGDEAKAPSKMKDVLDFYQKFTKWFQHCLPSC